MGVTIAIAQVAADVGGGNQNITTADLGGLTPKGVYLIATRGITNSAAADTATWCVGAASGASNRWASCSNSQNGQGTTNTDKRATTDECILSLTTDGSGIDGEADFSAWIANGITINWGVAPGAAWLITAIFFAGTDVTCHANVFTANAVVDTATDVVDPGFEPDILLTSCVGDDFSDSTSTTSFIANGLVVNNGGGSVDQFCHFWRDANSAATTALTGRIDDNYGTGQLASTGGSIQWGGEFGSFDANGFSCTSRIAGSGGDKVGYLAVSFGGAVDFAGAIIDSPIGVGNDSQTGWGFTPQAVIMGMSQLSAINTGDTSGYSGAVAMSSFTASAEYSNSVASEDNVGTSNCQSLVDNTAINFPGHDGAAFFVASYVSMDADGWTLNWTAVDGTARKFWALAVGSSETPTPPTPAPTEAGANEGYSGIPSRFQSLALPILVSDPLWFTARRGYIETLTNRVSNYQHDITNTTGYDSATFQIQLNQSAAEDWVMTGLGRHIIVKDDALVTVWEGFVNKIQFKVGTTTISVGPLLDVGNRVSVIYSTIDTTTEPPTLGVRAVTAVSNDTASQAKYAIFEQVISQGGSTAALAQIVRDKYLQELKEPPRSGDDNFSQTTAPMVRVDCLGYYYFLDAYTYTQTGVTGEENLSVKITNILADDPNGIFSTDYTGIQENTVQVAQYENDETRAKTLIEELVEIGDASDNAYNFMVLAGRKVYYSVAPTEAEYILRLSDRTRTLEDRVGNVIRPWAATAGKWRKNPDLFVGRSNPTDIRRDFRCSYVTKATFIAPNNLRLTGDELEELPQLLSKVNAGSQL